MPNAHELDQLDLSLFRASRPRRPGPGRCPRPRGKDTPLRISSRAAAGRQEADDRADRDPEAPDARLAAHDGGVEGDPGNGFHRLSRVPGRRGGPCDPPRRTRDSPISVPRPAVPSGAELQGLRGDEGGHQAGLAPPATRRISSWSPRSGGWARSGAGPRGGGQGQLLAVEPGLEVGRGVEDQLGVEVLGGEDRGREVGGLRGVVAGQEARSTSPSALAVTLRQAGFVGARRQGVSGSSGAVRGRPGRRPGTGRRCSPAPSGWPGRRGGRPGRGRSSPRPALRASARPR